MSNVTPFLDVPTFAGMFRPLTAAETNLATLLLNAASLWIRDPARCPGLDSNDPMAQLVTFDVVRQALAVPAQFAGYTSYEQMSDDRSEGGTFAALADLLAFTEWHRELLGLSGAAAPVANGMCSGFPMPNAIQYGGGPAGVTNGRATLVAYQTDAYPWGFFNDSWLYP